MIVHVHRFVLPHSVCGNSRSWWVSNAHPRLRCPLISDTWFLSSYSLKKFNPHNEILRAERRRLVHLSCTYVPAVILYQSTLASNPDQRLRLSHRNSPWSILEAWLWEKCVEYRTCVMLFFIGLGQSPEITETAFWTLYIRLPYFRLASGLLCTSTATSWLWVCMPTFAWIRKYLNSCLGPGTYH